jgi:hypothetical protein
VNKKNHPYPHVTGINLHDELKNPFSSLKTCSVKQLRCSTSVNPSAFKTLQRKGNGAKRWRRKRFRCGYFMGKLFCHALRNPWLNIKRNHIVVFIFFLRMHVICKALGFREKEKQNQKRNPHCGVIPLMSGEIIPDSLRP